MTHLVDRVLPRALRTLLRVRQSANLRIALRQIRTPRGAAIGAVAVLWLVLSTAGSFLEFVETTQNPELIYLYATAICSGLLFMMVGAGRTHTAMQLDRSDRLWVVGSPFSTRQVAAYHIASFLTTAAPGALVFIIVALPYGSTIWRALAFGLLAGPTFHVLAAAITVARLRAERLLGPAAPWVAALAATALAAAVGASLTAMPLHLVQSPLALFDGVVGHTVLWPSRTLACTLVDRAPCASGWASGGSLLLLLIAAIGYLWLDAATYVEASATEPKEASHADTTHRASAAPPSGDVVLRRWFGASTEVAVLGRPTWVQALRDGKARFLLFGPVVVAVGALLFIRHFFGTNGLDKFSPFVVFYAGVLTATAVPRLPELNTTLDPRRIAYWRSLPVGPQQLALAAALPVIAMVGASQLATVGVTLAMAPSAAPEVFAISVGFMAFVPLYTGLCQSMDLRFPNPIRARGTSTPTLWGATQTLLTMLGLTVILLAIGSVGASAAWLAGGSVAAGVFAGLPVFGMALFGVYTTLGHAWRDFDPAASAGA